MKIITDEPPVETVWISQTPRPMVQIICLTIDGQKIACLGPVLHMPHMDLNVGDIQEIEFGETIPASLAVKLLDGSMADDLQ